MPSDLLVLISNNRNTYLFSDTRPVTCQILKKCPTVPPTHMCTLPPRFREGKKNKQGGDIIVPASFWCYTHRIKQRNFHSVDCQPYLMIYLDLLAFCSVALNVAERRVLDLVAVQSVTRPLCRGGPPPSLPGSDYVKVEQALLSNIVGHSIYLIVPSNYTRGCRFENSE